MRQTYMTIFDLPEIIIGTQRKAWSVLVVSSASHRKPLLGLGLDAQRRKCTKHELTLSFMISKIFFDRPQKTRGGVFYIRGIFVGAAAR
jgi:hypothetical protein